MFSENKLVNLSEIKQNLSKKVFAQLEEYDKDLQEKEIDEVYEFLNWEKKIVKYNFDVQSGNWR